MNILAIGAHFDDVELGCGGTLVKHAQNRDKVIIYVATPSGYSNYNNKLVRSGKLAYREGKEAARVLGATLLCGKFKTLRLEFTDELNVELLKVIENNRIDLIYSHWLGDVHHDHIALARATCHSGRHVKRLLMYRSNWYHSFQEFKGNFYVDISRTWAVKEKTIMAHKSEYERVGRKWIEFFRKEAENAGQRIGVPLAEVFELVKWVE